MNRANIILKYIHYYLTASNGRGHGTHSPFAYNFIRKVLLNKKSEPPFEKIERMRNDLLRDESVINVEDFGAGSIVTKSNNRSIASIAKNAGKPKKYAQLLYRITQYYQPANILELGTSLGISTSYIASANKNASVLSLEGSDAIANRARKNINGLGLQNVEIITGNFDDTLLNALQKLNTVDMVFFDGNHRKEPTIRYFQSCLPNAKNDSFFIFDDIHWSNEMEEAWKEIKGHPDVTLSIDLFFIGIVFFRKELREKQHFTIRY